DVPPQLTVFLGKLRRFAVRCQKAVLVVLVQLADPRYPAERPFLFRRPGPRRLQEVASDMRPAEGQNDLPFLDLLHRLVRRVAVNAEDPFLDWPQMLFGHVVRPATVEDEDHGLLRMEDPQEPAEADLAFHG